MVIGCVNYNIQPSKPDGKSGGFTYTEYRCLGKPGLKAREYAKI